LSVAGEPRSINVRLLLEEARIEAEENPLAEKVKEYAPTQLPTSDLRNPKLALGVLFYLWSLIDMGEPDEEDIAEFIAVLKFTKALRGKTLDAMLQNIRGEPVYIPVPTPAEQLPRPQVQQQKPWYRRIFPW